MPQVAVLEYFDTERLDALLVGVARALPADHCDVAEVAVLVSACARKSHTILSKLPHVGGERR